MFSKNMNHWAKMITLEEGLKKNLSIAQCKEVLRIILLDLKEAKLEDIIDLLRRIR